MKFRFLGLCLFLSISVFAQQQFTIQPQQVSFNNQRFDLGKQNIFGLIKQQQLVQYDSLLGNEGY